MGHESARARQCFYVHLAGCLMGAFLIITAGCQPKPLPTGGQSLAAEVDQRLSRGAIMLQNGDYDAARRESHLILNHFPGQADDEALYLLGLAWVHPDNPRQDIRQADRFFRRIVDEHPHSTLITAAQTWLALIAWTEECQKNRAQMETTSLKLKQQLKVEATKRNQLEERLQQMKAIDLNME